MGRGLSIQQKHILVSLYTSPGVDCYRVNLRMGRKGALGDNSPSRPRTPTGRTSFAFSSNVQRASVSRSVLRLEERGLIECGRGSVTDWNHPYGTPEEREKDPAWSGGEWGSWTKEIRNNDETITDLGKELVESLIEKGEAQWETRTNYSGEYRILILSVNPDPLAEDENAS